MPTIQAAQLERLVIDIFIAAGTSSDEAQVVAAHLVEANLVGHDSHGVIRVIQYIETIKAGLLRPGAPMEIVHETATTAVLNGNWGFGQVIAQRGLALAIAKAKTSGLGAVGLRHCNHIGRLGAYTSSAAQQGFIGLVTVNGHGGGLIQAPWGGSDRRLSTNPISIGVPNRYGAPVVLDIATSVVAEGKVRVKLQRGEPLPQGWIIDAQGQPSTNPADLYGPPLGALLPLGGEVGHKGFGLAFIIDILSGALTGAGCSRAFDARAGNGTFLLVVNPGAFGPADAFREQVDSLIKWVKAAPPAPGFREVLVPGEVEAREEARRRREGIFIEEQTWRQLTALAAR